MEQLLLHYPDGVSLPALSGGPEWFPGLMKGLRQWKKWPQLGDFIVFNKTSARLVKPAWLASWLDLDPSAPKPRKQKAKAVVKKPGHQGD